MPVPPSESAPASTSATDSDEEEVASSDDEEENRLLDALLHVYEQPDRHSGLYNYAKALEAIESALLGGFYYKHYLLAKNVIGSESKGTGRLAGTNRAVAALQATFQAAVFPELDHVRSMLGAKIDRLLAHRKGRIMTNIEIRRSNSPAGRPIVPSTS
jgi:tryptophan 2,3-dioxygenase